MPKMEKKLTKKQREEMLAQRYQEIKPKPSSRMRTEKELMDDDKICEEH